MSELNYDEISQIFKLYDDTRRKLRHIKKDLENASILNSQKEEYEVAYHYAAFRNVKNALVARMNSIVSESGFDGFKENELMLPSEVLNEKKEFKRWEKLAFDEKGVKAYERGLSSKKHADKVAEMVDKSDPTCLFQNAQNWEVLAFGDVRDKDKLAKEMLSIELPISSSNKANELVDALEKSDKLPEFLQNKIKNLSEKTKDQIKNKFEFFKKSNDEDVLNRVSNDIMDCILKDTAKNYNPEKMEEERKLKISTSLSNDTDKLLEHWVNTPEWTEEATKMMEDILNDTKKITLKVQEMGEKTESECVLGDSKRKLDVLIKNFETKKEKAKNKEKDEILENAIPEEVSFEDEILEKTEETTEGIKELEYETQQAQKTSC